MRLVVERDALLAAMTTAQALVDRKATVPILSHVLLRADAGGGLELTVNDLDMQLRLPCAAEVEEAGAAAIPAAPLYEVLRNLAPGAQARLESDETGLRVRVLAGRRRSTLPTLPPSDFPLFAEEDMAAGGPISPKILRGLIDTTLPSVCRETSRYTLCGVYLHLADDAGSGGRQIVAVATDGKRLASTSVIAPAAFEDGPPIILPTKVARAMLKLLEGVADDVVLRWAESKVELRAGPARLIARLVDAQYPDYRRAIPEDNTNVLRAPKAALVSALKGACVFASGKTPAVRLELDAGSLTFSARDVELGGEGSETLDVEYQGPAMGVGVNGSMLADLIGQIQAHDAELRFGAPLAAIRLADDLEPATVFVVMPLRG